MGLIVGVGPAGCAPPPCLPPTEAPVTSPDGAPSEVVAHAHDAISTFASWIGGDRICVSEIRLVADPERGGNDTRSSYEPDIGLVRIRQGRRPTAEVVRHGLCRVIDHAEDISWPHRDLLLEHVEGYGRDRRGIGDKLARACEPRPVQLELPCEDPPPLDGFLREAVWWGWEPDFRMGTFGTAARGITGLPPDRPPSLTVARGRDAVFVTWGDTVGAATPFDRFLRIDVATAEVVEALPLHPVTGTWRVIGGYGDPLSMDFGDLARAWRLRPGGLEEIPFPATIRDVHRGTVHGDDAWLLAAIDDEEAPRLVRLDLTSGTVEPGPVPPSMGALRSLQGGPGGISATWRDAGESTLAVMPAAGDAWREVWLPPGFRPERHLPLADGSLVVIWSADRDGATLRELALHRNDRWVINAAACDGDRLPFGPLTTVGDGAALFERGGPRGVDRLLDLTELP